MDSIPTCLMHYYNESENMLYTLTTSKSVNEAAKALQDSIVANKFGVMQIHNLQESMTKKDVEFNHECLIFEVCNPVSAKKVLEANMSLSTALPCRISVYEEDSKTYISTIKPTMLLSMFKVPQMEEVALEVENTIFKIMQEAI